MHGTTSSIPSSSRPRAREVVYEDVANGIAERRGLGPRNKAIALRRLWANSQTGRLCFSGGGVIYMRPSAVEEKAIERTGRKLLMYTR